MEVRYYFFFVEQTDQILQKVMKHSFSQLAGPSRSISTAFLRALEQLGLLVKMTIKQH